ncbi:SDR family oxidoreductase [Vibrio sp. Of7-15]|uniref:SDR family oxidoreductase n=1 Tax=Vibrio sp. Of7-15 TaxID=2724879 RepID=UPI001EF3AE58|nr:SDR family oxidoreductase [Vibrio sp. Of7-15]MCG7495867.1 SDR family oxidoreductase [Vibrio sp. Of7-15]
MKTLFITGANRGIGLALTQLYLKSGWQVHATCRNTLLAENLTALTQTFHKLTVHELDVTDYAAVDSLAQQLKEFSIDILFNNAGYYGPKGYGFGHTNVEEWRQVLEVNTIAPLKLAEAFHTHVQNSHEKIIACMSSRVGSMTDNTSGGGYIYRSSKAALNSVVKSLSNDLTEKGITAVALHPGWVQTEMGGNNALISTEESAAGLKAVLDNMTLNQSGHFYNYQGKELPW